MPAPSPNASHLTQQKPTPICSQFVEEHTTVPADCQLLNKIHYPCPVSCLLFR